MVQSIAEIPDAIQRSLYIKECAVLMNIAEDVLLREVARMRMRSLGDREAEERIETRELPLCHAPGRKFEINIDVIAAHFEKGETVSLETLKERGLIPKSTQAIKVLARGSLDKPLTVLAHDFSVAAVKMILLTGGSPILIERMPSPALKR